ncbi:unnamed protein product [Dracunculus medinensis]|uniref:Venom protein n=1 Tax=Dracunculus medinensis TaxID=318479 RepID=A0A0N4URG9_DRAME|nr:unnamed protein product [Dracunculus medinensis]
MITYLLILVLLCNFASGDEVDLEICVKSVRDSQNALKRRPSVPVQNCQDRDMACPEIFKFTADAGMKLANNLNPLVSELFDSWMYNADEFIFSLLAEPSVDSLLNFHYCWRLIEKID